MGKLWSLVFLMVPVLGVAMFVWPMLDLWPLQGHWLPENINRYGHVIDDLFLFILGLTGIIFVGTGVAKFWFLLKYDADRNAEPVRYTHGSHKLEVVWSVIPAATLLFLAVFQMNAWADAKMRRPTEIIDGVEVPMRPLVEVTARQFEWRIQYAGPDKEMGTEDDVFVVNDLHVPVDEEVVVVIKSQDVLHSFFLPNLRVKQDIVPGMKQFVWFEATRTGVYDLVCAELCGWGHYKMRGQLTVESREKFDKWLAETYREQERSEYTVPRGDDE